MAHLIDSFPSWQQRGIFTHIHTAGWAPWENDESISPEALDLEYLGNRSGLREPSVLIRKLTHFRCPPTLSDGQLDAIVSMIRAKYAADWQRVWDAWHQEYDPLENYNGTETRTHSEKITTEASHKSVSEVAHDNHTSANVVPFGGSTPVQISTGTASGTAAANRSVTSGDAADNRTTVSGNAADNVDTISRHGNLGVTTSQQMLQSELDLRRQSYFEYVYACLDDVLTIPYYSI